MPRRSFRAPEWRARYAELNNGLYPKRPNVCLHNPHFRSALREGINAWLIIVRLLRRQAAQKGRPARPQPMNAPEA